MASWRLQGYVPDSEGEDDVEPPPPILPPESTASEEFQDIDVILNDGVKIGLTAGKSEDLKTPVNTCQAALDSGIEGGLEYIFQDIKSEAPYMRSFGSIEVVDIASHPSSSALAIEPDPNNKNATATEQENDSSQLENRSIFGSSQASELTTLPSTPPPNKFGSTPQQYRDYSSSDQAIQTFTPNNERRSNLVEAEIISEQWDSAAIPQAEYNHRSLRKRNPIQMHPYMLEGELYRQTLKARGLKPLRMAQIQDDDSGTRPHALIDPKNAESEDEQDSQNPPADNGAYPFSNSQSSSPSLLQEMAESQTIGRNSPESFSSQISGLSNPIVGQGKFGKTLGYKHFFKNRDTSNINLEDNLMETGVKELDSEEGDIELKSNGSNSEQRIFHQEGSLIGTEDDSIYSLDYTDVDEGRFDPQEREFPSLPSLLQRMPTVRSRTKRRKKSSCPQHERFSDLENWRGPNKRRKTQHPIERYPKTLSSSRIGSLAQKETLFGRHPLSEIPNLAIQPKSPLKNPQAKFRTRKTYAALGERVSKPSAKTGLKRINRNLKSFLTKSRPVAATHRPLRTDHQSLPAQSRQAQIESLESEYLFHRPAVAFQTGLSYIERLWQTKQKNIPIKANLQLSRFLKSYIEFDDEPEENDISQAQEDDSAPLDRVSPRKKRAAKPKEIFLPIGLPHQTPKDWSIYGLNIIDSSRSRDLEITPFNPGTKFESSTFLGRGLLSKLLSVSRSYDTLRGQKIYSFNDAAFQWGPWNDKVSSQMAVAFERIGDRIEHLEEMQTTTLTENGNAKHETSGIAGFHTFIVEYLHDYLSFTDPIDRQSFVQSLVQILRNYLCKLNASLGDPRKALQATVMGLTTAHQVLEISREEPTSNHVTQNELEDVYKETAQLLINLLLRIDSENPDTLYQEVRKLTRTTTPIIDESFYVQAWIIAMKTLDQAQFTQASFWELLNIGLGNYEVISSKDALVFEKIWQIVFSVLPLQEFNQEGVLETGKRFQSNYDNWPMINTLLNRIFILNNSSERRPPSFNDYFRATLSRCHHLIVGWGWRNCEIPIKTMFNFFASNNLAYLCNEESSGSARFLEQLDKEQMLEIIPEDRSFHIFLKIIGIGLKSLSRLFPERKVQNIAFRLIPNHGRQHLKDESPSHQDLESLRNHHDLLCVLYWSLAPSIRPSTNVIRDLVNPLTSHRAACHISLKAWTNLVRFQLSTDEPAAVLHSFRIWHSEFIEQVLVQYSLSQAEATATQAAFPNKKPGPFSRDNNILKGQNQIHFEEIISDALISLKSALGTAKDLEHAGNLLSKASMGDIFRLFDVKKIRINKLVKQSLDIILEYVRLCSIKPEPQATLHDSEESQDYGDWSGLEEMSSEVDKKQAARKLLEISYDPLCRLLSNCFGADAIPEESLLIKVTECWVLVAHLLVSHDLKQWGNFLGTYDSESWHSLRKTEQTRKFTSLVLALIIKSDPASYSSDKETFLSFWMTSIVEREALLKYQHEFTNSLVNADQSNPLFQNLPSTFKKGVLSMTAAEFQARRLSLISTVLANMRESLEDVGIPGSSEAVTLRQMYRNILKKLMESMKSNYQELSGGANSSAGVRELKGLYVEFAHKIIEILQEHTIDICPIDRYFTDSAQFPLPSNDPTYVTGRLKNYSVRLTNSGAHKQLVFFIQSTSERAATDGQQSYLIEQLYSAMSGTFEVGDGKRPTLRAFLSMGIFPAYIQEAFRIPTGWIFVRPILIALTKMFDVIIVDMDATNEKSNTSIALIITTLLDALRQAAELLVDHSGLLEQPSSVSILALMFSTITSILPALDYLQRSAQCAQRATKCVTFFSHFAKFVLQCLAKDDDITSPYIASPDIEDMEPPLASIRDFCAKELRERLMKSWVQRGDGLYYLRVNGQQRIADGLESIDMARGSLKVAISAFYGLGSRLSGLDMGDVEIRARSSRSRCLKGLML
ncbi:MAG: hypothetical protein M1829_006237 [Trizodia sp. TS-e1964]|nr:MAG: hypothetical protein M1829_006237 [Trizodia sp. TS-e1964]